MAALMPRPGTRIIPERWEAWHQPVAEGQMTGACRITRPVEPGTFDEAAGRSTYPEPLVLYDGACRFQASQRLNLDRAVGDAQVTVHRYQVALPVAVDGLRINDQVNVTGCTSDPGFVGSVLRVVDILSGSLLWQRDLVCDDTTPTTR